LSFSTWFGKEEKTHERREGKSVMTDEQGSYEVIAASESDTGHATAWSRYSRFLQIKGIERQMNTQEHTTVVFFR
jgi:hypothetical protein